MSRIKNYVEKAFNDIPYSERKEQLIQEIIQNLEEKVHDLIEQGKSEEDAVNKAIVEFGDIGDIRKELCTNDTIQNSTQSLALGFSIWGSVLCIGLFLFINFYYSPHVIWFIYPTFAILWWPLAMYFRWLKKKQGV